MDKNGNLAIRKRKFQNFFIKSKLLKSVFFGLSGGTNSIDGE